MNFLQRQHNLRFLWIAILSIAIGESLHLVEIYQIDKQVYYAQGVSRKINNIIKEIGGDQEAISAYLDKDHAIVFSQLNKLTVYPTYLFRDHRLVYWSDNKFLPRDTLLYEGGGIHYIDAGNKKFLGMQKTMEYDGGMVHILTLISLFVDFNITNDFLQSGYNQEVFINSNLNISGSEEYFPIYGPDNTFLFSVEFLPGYVTGNYWISVLAVFFISLGIVALIIYCYLRSNEIARRKKLYLSVMLLLMALSGIRIFMLLAQFPIDYDYLPLFDSKYYASSLLNPSLGDLFVNLLFLIVFTSFIWMHVSHRQIVELLQRSGFVRYLVSVSAVLVQLGVLYFIYKLIQSLGTHSQWDLDVTTGFNFSMFRWFSYLMFVIGVVILLFVTYACQKILFRFIGDNPFMSSIVLLAGIILFIMIGGLFSLNLLLISLIGSGFLILSHVIDVKTIFIQLQYKTFVYLLIIFILSSLLGAVAINDVRRLKEGVSRERFSEQLMQENDPLTEFFLQEASRQIQEDVFIKNRLSSPFGSKEIIEEKIRRVHLNNYLDKYEIRILMFNSRGDPLVPGSGTYFQIRNNLARAQYRTEDENIYFYNIERPNVERPESSKRYLDFIPLYRYNTTIGYIILELELKRIIPYRIYPRLLLDDRESLRYFEDQYDYALFRDDVLLNTSGNFNYERNFMNSNLSLARLYTTGIKQAGYHHFGYESTNGKIYVISSPVYRISYFFANFSFLFIILSFLFLVALIAYAVYFNLKGRALNYITKIQLFLNLAFFIPLFVISLTTLTRSTSDYKNEIEMEYMSVVESTGNNLAGYLQNFRDNVANIEELTSSINELADFSELDMDIFSVRQNMGRLLVATQPLIYDKGILANIIEPVAFAEIMELGVKGVVLDESFGKLSYKVAYAGIKSRDGSLDGIISIPFFGSQEIISRNLTSLIVNILGIFTLIFIGFVILSFIVSTYLTFPLRFVTERLRKTTLTGINEPLQYTSGDEIGRLVSEYNKMLLKLDESKKALAQTEKEAAWREMAKQVAHEIKNPLTPMKLTLQHLNMRLADLDESERVKFEKSINSLLHNIDTLSDIATSFSDYAHMPMPEEEKFDIVKLLKKSIAIYVNNREIEFHTGLTDDEILVMGDPNWISRSVSNLIINGIQAVEEGVKPVIRLSLRHTSQKRALITVEDNGKGIPDEIRDKIFMPNFSTKYTGSGIGLAIAKRAVEHAGGKLWFESKIGFGTSFYIELPVMS